MGITKPYSRGRITLTDGSSGAPRIDPGYLTDPRDLANLATGYRLVRELMRQAPLASLQAAVGDGPAPDDEAAVTAYIRANASTQFHPRGYLPPRRG